MEWRSTNGFYREEVTNVGNEETRVLIRLQTHISSVRSVVTLPSFRHSRDSNKLEWIVFSGGGRAQLVSWRIEYNLERKELYSVPKAIYFCHDSVGDSKQRMLKKTYKNEPSPDSDKRIMDVAAWNCADEMFVIAVGCSDGNIKLHEYNNNTGNVSSFGVLKFHQHCVLKVIHTSAVNVTKQNVLISTDTDGQLALWDVTHLCPQTCCEMNQEGKDCLTSTFNSLEIESEMNNIRPFHIVKLNHNAGVNSVAVFNHSTQKIILAAGGDDGSIHLITVTLKSSVSPNLDECSDAIKHNFGRTKVESFCEFIHVQKHAAQVTAIRFIGDSYMLSASVDQRVILWRLEKEDGDVTQLCFLKCKLVSIPDVSDMLLFGDSNSESNTTLCVVGEGIQLITLQSMLLQ